MLEVALKELVDKICKEKCEKQNLEIKSAFDGTPKRLYDTLSSFSNQDGGGTIIFGISEKEEYKIVGVFNAQKLQSQVVEQCKQMEPEIRPLFSVAKINGEIIVSAEIAGLEIHQRPCFYKGTGRLKGSYVRVADQDILMTEYEVYSFESYKKQIHNDLRVVDRAGIGDFDNALLSNYISKLQIKKPKIANLAITKLFALQGIVDKENGTPTIAGILCFGQYPQYFFPQLSITAVVVKGLQPFSFNSKERFVDNQRIEGTIPEMLDAAVSFVYRNMTVSTIIDSKTGKRNDKEEYPIIAIREAILNALIHRDYSIYTESSPIRIIIYPNRIEIENPGGLYGRLTIDTIGKQAGDTRNVYVANILEVSIDNENRFSGIPTIRGLMAEYNLPEPVFENMRGTFKIVLMNKEKLDGITSSLIEFCKTPKTREQIAQFLQKESISYVVKIFINPLIKEGLLNMTVPTAPRSKKQQYYSIKK
jgi:ATP-dependent DNA helicase RecG